MMLCRLCARRLVGEERDYCGTCCKFLRWKYKKELEERLAQDEKTSEVRR